MVLENTAPVRWDWDLLHRWVTYVNRPRGQESQSFRLIILRNPGDPPEERVHSSLVWRGRRRIFPTWKGGGASHFVSLQDDSGMDLARVGWLVWSPHCGLSEERLPCGDNESSTLMLWVNTKILQLDIIRSMRVSSIKALKVLRALTP